MYIHRKQYNFNKILVEALLQEKIARGHSRETNIA